MTNRTDDQDDDLTLGLGEYLAMIEGAISHA